MITVYCDAETAGVVQSEIDRQHVSSEMTAARHPYLPPGMVAVIEDGKPQFHSVDLIFGSIGGLRVLMTAAQRSGGVTATEIAALKAIQPAAPPVVFANDAPEQPRPPEGGLAWPR